MRHSQHAMGLSAALGQALRRPVAPEHRTWFAFGWMVLVLFLFQIGTGILLSFYYDPSPENAAASVRLLMRDVSNGWLVRGLHYWSSTAIVVLTFLQLVRVFVTGGYRRNPTSWTLGLALLFLILGMAFTGDILAWDDEAYWTARRVTEQLESVPLVGPVALRLLQGEREVGDQTVGRAYAVHALLLPWLIGAVAALNVWLLRRRRAAEAGEGEAR